MPRLDRRRRPARTLFAPALVAAATAVGLGAGLLGEGAADWLAWAGLALPVAFAFALRRRG